MLYPMSTRDHMEYAAFRLLEFGLGCLSLNQARGALGGLGRFAGRRLRYRRAVVTSQLTAVFPDLGAARVEDLADRVYEHLGLTAAEAFCDRDGQLLAGITVEPGWDILDEALSHGKGAIVATGHMGNFELGGAVLAHRYGLLDVVKRQRNPIFDAHINALRSARGIETVGMDEAGPAVLRQLKRGGLVALLLDQDAGPDGMQVDFLGRPASTWPGVARISIRTGCPVVPMALVRQPDRSHRLRIRPALWPTGLSDRREDVRTFLARISLATEAFIRDNPEQWFWVHRRWKHQGDGERS